MAKPDDEKSPKPPAIIERASPVAKAANIARTMFRKTLKQAEKIRESDALLFDGGQTIATMLGFGKRPARTRQFVYQKWALMAGDPIISTALQTLVTAALGGHETTGDIVFIEERETVEKAQPKGKPPTKPKKPEKPGQYAKMVEEIRKDLGPILNRIAYTLCYNAGAYGDSYGRVYAQPGVGVVDVNTDELVNPVLVQPYEQGTKTVGFVVFTGPKQMARLTTLQMVRMKMPRTIWVPQNAIMEKSARVALEQDNLDDVPVLPALAGGSFLFNAEEAYDNLMSALAGLLGQRVLDSIDEQMLGVNLESMNADQQQRMLNSVAAMLMKSKRRAEEAVSAGRPVLERIRHIIPIFNEKQVASIQQFPSRGTTGAQSYSIEDIMLYARLLAGSLGVDLAMLGFADQLAGGLGEGGFFRVSAQAAERARVIRHAFTDAANAIIDIHTFHKYKTVFSEADRPWTVNFAGSISALEAERQRTRSDAMNASVLMTQALQQLKELGATEEQAKLFMIKLMLMDEEIAEQLASIVDATPREPAGGMGGGDPFGGGGDGAPGEPRSNDADKDGEPNEEDNKPSRPPFASKIVEKHTTTHFGDGK